MTKERSQAELLLIQIAVREPRTWRSLTGDNKGARQGRFQSARTQLRSFEEAHGCRMAIKIAIRHRLLLKRRMMPMLRVGRPPVSWRKNPIGKICVRSHRVC